MADPYTLAPDVLARMRARAAHCTTHHAACDCIEVLTYEEIQRLHAEVREHRAHREVLRRVAFRLLEAVGNSDMDPDGQLVETYRWAKDQMSRPIEGADRG